MNHLVVANPAKSSNETSLPRIVATLSQILSNSFESNLLPNVFSPTVTVRKWIHSTLSILIAFVFMIE